MASPPSSAEALSNCSGNASSQQQAALSARQLPDTVTARQRHGAKERGGGRQRPGCKGSRESQSVSAFSRSRSRLEVYLPDLPSIGSL